MAQLRIQLRHDTAANWASENPILRQGEAGVETDTGQAKVGDGETAYNALPYIGSGLVTPAATLPELDDVSDTIDADVPDGGVMLWDNTAGEWTTSSLFTVVGNTVAVGPSITLDSFGNIVGTYIAAIEGGIESYTTGSGGLAYDVFITGEAQPRLIVSGDGKLLWGSGLAVGDVNLYRLSANVLRTDDDFWAVGALKSDSYVYSYFNDAKQVLIGEWPVGKPGIAFGVDLDTNLYRFGVNQLATDSQLILPAASGTDEQVLFLRSGFLQADGGFNQSYLMEFAWRDNSVAGYIGVPGNGYGANAGITFSDNEGNPITSFGRNGLLLHGKPIKENNGPILFAPRGDVAQGIKIISGGNIPTLDVDRAAGQTSADLQRWRNEFEGPLAGVTFDGKFYSLVNGTYYYVLTTNDISNYAHQPPVFFPGEDGEDGLTIPGQPGAAGSAGATGATGAAGAAGPPGLPGEDAEDPLVIPGPVGSAGAAGSAGATGAAGAPGPPGPPGDDPDDIQVVPGPQGPTGTAGQSIMGPPGQPGADPDDFLPIPGPTGAAGVNGATGPMGPPGWSGEDGEWLPLPGPEGLQGDAGVEGQQGIQGVQGRPGVDGQDGEDALVIPGPTGAAGASGSGTTTAFTKDLGVCYRSGTFDITGLSGLTTDRSYDVRQSGAAISTKGNARDESEMDTIIVTGYAVDATTIRCLWYSANGAVVVGTYAFVSVT